MRALKKKIVGIACMLLSAGLIISSTQTLKATSIDDEKEKQQELEQELSGMQDTLDKLETLKNDTEAYIAELDSQLAVVSARIVELNEQAVAKQVEINETNSQLEQQEADIQSQYDAMKMRIKFMYENGNAEYLDMLLGSKSLGEMLNKAEYITELTEYDRDMLDKMRQTKAAIEETKAVLEQEKSDLNELLASAETEQANVETLVEAKQRQLLETQTQIDTANAEIANKQTELAEQASLIAEMEAIERRRAEEAERRRQELLAQQQANQNQSKPSGDKNTATIPDISYDGEGFAWPVPGYYYITSDFGYRGDPFGVSANSEYHKGIDIGAPNGSTIIAASSGQVAWAYHSTSAGNWVGIDHGNGLYSVYMHMSYSIVTEGQYVNKGDTIGYVGSTGMSTGNHLHFAVRLNGAYVNPHDYLGQ